MKKPPVLFWVIGSIALLWNFMGVQAYLGQARNTVSFRAQYSEEQLTIIDVLPMWYTGVFAIAVFVSILGCVLLLMKKKLAKPILLAALIAVLIQTFYNLFVNDGRHLYGTFEYVMLLMIPAFSIFLYLFADKSVKKGWLG